MVFDIHCQVGFEFWERFSGGIGKFCRYYMGRRVVCFIVFLERKEELFSAFLSRSRNNKGVFWGAAFCLIFLFGGYYSCFHSEF